MYFMLTDYILVLSNLVIIGFCYPTRNKIDVLSLKILSLVEKGFEKIRPLPHQQLRTLQWRQRIHYSNGRLRVDRCHHYLYSHVRQHGSEDDRQENHYIICLKNSRFLTSNNQYTDQ